MRYKKLLLVLFAAIASLKLSAQFEYGKIPDIHVEGNQLVDAQGHPVRFFGFMDTPSCWFNDGRWGWGKENDGGVTDCKNYFKKILSAATDTLNGTFCNIFRLHMEPAWVGGNTTYCRFCGKAVSLGTAKGNTCKYCGKLTFYKGSDGKTYDPDGIEVSGEADTHTRDMAKVKKYLGSVFYPIAENASKEGMLVVMRPPGVCPGTIKVGSYYQKYLLDVWDIVSSNAKVKNAKGWLSLELANEPVAIVDANGQRTDKAHHDFFQPIVDKIRANGFEGIIWVPGSVWQQEYKPYAKYPIEDANLGYAVHNYAGWYGGSDNTGTSATNVNNYTNNFHNSVPVLDTNPIVITEVDWSPSKPSAEGTGHQNEVGEWVDGNYGTWATATTSKWGVLYKGLIDKYDNISMTLSSTACYLDIDKSINKSVSASTNGKITPYPAFKDKMEADGKNPWDASGVSCWQWYREYYYQQHDGYSNDNITIKEVTTKSIPDMTLSPGSSGYISIAATFLSGRKNKIQGSCHYEVADPTVAKAWMGRITGVGVGETDVTATYTDITGESFSLTFHVKVSLFPLTKEAFNPAVQGGGAVTTVSGSMLAYSSVKNGLAGWQYGDGVDISQFDTISVTMASKPATTTKAALRFYDGDDLSGSYAELPLAGQLEAKGLLKQMVKTDEKPLDLTKLTSAVFYTSSATTIRIREVRLSKANEEDVILQLDEQTGRVVGTYTMGGVRTKRTQKGVNILRSSDGSAKKVVVK